MPFCVVCGQRVEASDAKCPRCGAAIRGNGPSAGARDQQVINNSPWVRGKTVRVKPGEGQPRQNVASLTFTFMEGARVLAKTTLPLTRNVSISFGREGCDINVAPPSQTVSQRHGLIFVRDGRCYVRDEGSTNGLYLNGTKQAICQLRPGDVVSIGRPIAGQVRTVMIVGEPGMRWDTKSLSGLDSLRIGRTPDNDLVLSSPTVSAQHARMNRMPSGGWTITDLRSTNGTQANGRFVAAGKPETLCSGSVVVLGSVRAIFLDVCLVISISRQGIDVECDGLVRYRNNGGRKIVTTDHVSLRIKRGDFVAIVGGSGSGKSTILNELNGTEPADEGRVLVDGMDLYANYDALKTSIGYVPQQDIVYDNLTLESMLASAAKLRMTPDSTAQERAARVDEIIKLLELDGVRKNFIGRLSGGQKKRASIAVELLADPRLLFLDEPTSGLDPGIERRLMQTLAKMAQDGRTIILVTHTTLNLHLCDQVVFLGQGGKLCYAGQPTQALEFFGVNDLVDIYNKIGEDPQGWQQRFAASRESLANLAPEGSNGVVGARKMPGFMSQFLALSWRYIRLILNDHSRLLLLLLQGPLLAAVISLVASKDCFAVYERGKSCMFALSCAAFWVGIFDSIQEVCKERDIFRREYQGGVGLGAYVASKAVVLGLLCLLQSAMLCSVFLAVSSFVGKTGGELGAGCLFSSGALEMMVSVTLLMLSAMYLGLLVSALFDNPDRAIALAPLLIMPQILFAGVVFKLDEGSLAERVSYAVNCRWGMEALGTTLNLDAMDLAIYGSEITVPAQDKELENLEVEVPATQVDTAYGTMDVESHTETIDSYTAHIDETVQVIDSDMFEHDPDDLDGGMFRHSPYHLLRAWGILLAMSTICIIGSILILRIWLL